MYCALKKADMLFPLYSVVCTQLSSSLLFFFRFKQSHYCLDLCLEEFNNKTFDQKIVSCYIRCNVVNMHSYNNLSFFFQFTFINEIEDFKNLFLTHFLFLFSGGQYQVVAPSYYENGSVMMGNARGMGTAMRLVPPVLVNPAAAPSNNPGVYMYLLNFLPNLI